jgi:hypothetical protein
MENDLGVARICLTSGFMAAVSLRITRAEMIQGTVHAGSWSKE